MSAAPRHRTSLLSQIYDKLILIIMLIGLLGSALFLFLEIGWRRQELNEARWEQSWVEPKEVTPVELEGYNRQRDQLSSPIHSTLMSNALMVSEVRVSCVECQKPIAYDAVTCPFCGTEQPQNVPIAERDDDQDGIKNVDETKLGLNPLDPTDAERDLDEDGFTNLEEYLSGSDLSDPESYPEPAAKLRVLRLSRNPFKLRFQGAAKLQDDTVRYQLNMRTLERTYFAQQGEEIEGYTVLEYLPDAEKGPTLVLQQGDSKIRLEKGKAYTEFEIVADLVFLVNRQRYRAKLGDTINLRDREYKVIDMRREGVLIRDEKTGKKTLVGRLSGSERDMLMGGAGGPSQTGSSTPGASAFPN